MREERKGNSGCWRSHGLWTKFWRTLSTCREPGAQDSARRQSCQSSARATNKVPVRAEHADSEGARPYYAANAALPRRRGDRMNGGRSAFGTKRTFRSQRSMSALGVGADIARAAIECAASISLNLST